MRSPKDPAAASPWAADLFFRSSSALVDQRTISRTTGALLCALLLAGASLPYGHVASAETLNDALAATIANNPGLGAQRARTRATHQEVPIANAGYLPKVNASGAARVGNSDRRLNEDSSSFGDLQGPSSSWSAGYSVSIDQPLFDGFATPNALKEANANVRASEQDLTSTEQSVLLAAATAYLDVVHDRAVQSQRENSVNMLAAEVAAATQRYEKGLGSKTDIAQASARHADAKAIVALAKSQTGASRARYEQVVGRAPGDLVEPRLPEELLPPSVEAAISVGLQEHPAIGSAVNREEASRYTVAKIRGEQMPYVALRGSHEGNHYDAGTASNQLDTSLTARVVVPLFDGGVTNARIQQAKELSLGRVMELQDTKAQVAATIRASWAKLVGARQQVASRHASVEENRVALAGIREEQRLGQKALLDVLNAEQELTEAKVKQLDTQRDLIRAAYEMLATTGRLNVVPAERREGRIAERRDVKVAQHRENKIAEPRREQISSDGWTAKIAPAPHVNAAKADTSKSSDAAGAWKTEIRVAKATTRPPSGWRTHLILARAE